MIQTCARQKTLDTDGWTDGRIDERTDERPTVERTDKRADEWTDERTDEGHDGCKDRRPRFLLEKSNNSSSLKKTIGHLGQAIEKALW